MKAKIDYNKLGLFLILLKGSPVKKHQPDCRKAIG